MLQEYLFISNSKYCIKLAAKTLEPKELKDITLEGLLESYTPSLEKSIVFCWKMSLHVPKNSKSATYWQGALLALLPLPLNPVSLKENTYAISKHIT